MATQDHFPLVVEQELLSPQTAAVAAQLAVALHHSMAGNHDGDAIIAVGPTARPLGPGATLVFGKLPIG
jgi:hypothetical protein